MKPIHVHPLWGISLMLMLSMVIPGCASAPQATSPSPTAASPQTPIAGSPSPLATPPGTEIAPAPNSPSPIASPSALAAPLSAFRPDPNNPDILRDFDTLSPLPQTGKVTVRSDIDTLNTDRLLVDCPTDTAPYAYAESSNYRIQICSQEYDPWLPKYYIGKAKEGGDELRLINKNLDEARQLIFRNGDYRYTLYRDGARPERMNAYLEIYSPDDRKTYAEALVYLYEKTRRP